MRAAINSEIELGTAPARAAAPRPTFWQNEAKFANEINRSADCGRLAMDPIRRKKFRIADLSHELEEYKKTGDPRKLLDALRDEAQIKRFEAGIEAEEIKNLAVNVLRKAVASQDISNNMLLRIIASLSKSTKAVLKEVMSNRPADRGGGI
jgi:hypothetical protein